MVTFSFAAMRPHQHSVVRCTAAAYSEPGYVPRRLSRILFVYLQVSASSRRWWLLFRELALLSFDIVGTADGFLYRLQPEIAYNVALSLELEAVCYVAHELAHPYRQLAASAYALIDVRDVKLDEGEQVFFRDLRRALVVELYQRVLEAREELAERFRAGVYLSPERTVDVILLSLVMRCF